MITQFTDCEAVIAVALTKRERAVMLREEEETAGGETKPRFFTPAEVARMFRVSKMTVYRAIRDGDLPAVPMRGRWAVPARAIDTMERSALARLDPSQQTITDHDVADAGGRPGPGANQFGAGPLSTQRVAGYGKRATQAERLGRREGVV